MKNSSYHHAFTLLEMTFVIVILGIVAGISSEVIATAYESYINQRAIARSSIKTELAATQIANRLTYAIPGSIVGRKSANGVLIGIQSISGSGNNNDIIALEWIGYDRDSFIARDATPDNAVNRRPGWSGFCDLTATNRPNLANAIVNLVSPGSNFNLTNAIIANLSAARATTISGAGLYFSTSGLQIHDGATAYLAAGNNGIYTVANPHNIPAVNANAFSMDINAPLITTNVGEHYKLAWTAYALVLQDGNGDGTTDLVLHYNYRPWNGENWNTNGASQKVLLNNVSVFRFTGTQSSIRFKICKPEQTGTDSQGNPTTVAVCKEKVVIK